MNELQVFNFEENEVKTFMINDTPYFVANDVARILGYKNPSKATNDHCKKATTAWGNDSLGRRQKFKVIPESDLYRLIIKSQLPDAERFENWVMEEVLPQIRKTGSYSNVPANFAEALRLAADLEEEKAQLKIENEEMKPKALFADSVAASHTTILIGDLAKVLRGNGVNIGQNRLFEVLRKEGYLISRKGTSYNMPTQKAMDLGLFKVKETSITHSDGHVTVNKTPKVTGKGQQYFVNRFLARSDA